MSDWRKELSGILEKRARASRAEKESAQFEKFLQEVAKPALEELAEELKLHNRMSQIRLTPASILLTVRNEDTEEIAFRVLKRSVPTAIVPYAEVRLRKGLRFVKMESTLRDTTEPIAVQNSTKDDVINCFLRHYKMVLDAEQPKA